MEIVIIMIFTNIIGQFIVIMSMIKKILLFVLSMDDVRDVRDVEYVDYRIYKVNYNYKCDIFRYITTVLLIGITRC